MTIVTVQPAVPAPPAPTGLPDPRRVWVAVLLVVVGCAATRPLALHGQGLAVALLLVVNSGFQLARLLPAATRLAERSVLPLFALWMLSGTALLVLGSQSAGPMFAYLLTGYAGYRLSMRSALWVAASTAVLCAIALRVAELRHLEAWPWVVGLTVALPVFLGMANRSRDQAVTSAIEAARSAQRAAESEAREQKLAERARISRDIHDVLAHSLTGVSMQLELSEMLLDEGDVDRARASIDRAHSLVREGMAEARRAVTTLRSETLPLRQTLEAQFAGAGAVRVEGSPVELPTEATQAIVRAAQEALTNARRHAPGAPLEVTLRYAPAAVELQVDNGPPAGVRSPADAGSAAGHGSSMTGSGSVRTGSGMGLVGMRERAALLAGEVQAGPLPAGPLAGGWRVLLRLPVADASTPSPANAR